jgi:hypothetical protein
MGDTSNTKQWGFKMRRVPFLVFALAVLFTITQAGEVNARRGHCGRAAKRHFCNERTPLCKSGHSYPKKTYAQNYLCYLTKICYLGQNQYLYYANYHEAYCSVGPEPVYATGHIDDFGDNPNQICPDCEPDIGWRSVFGGFPRPLDPKFETAWKDNSEVTQKSDEQLSFRLLKEGGGGVTYKTRLFELVAKGKSIWVAFEIERFGDDVAAEPSPIPIRACDWNSIDDEGSHAFVFLHNGNKILLLTDQEE